MCFVEGESKTEKNGSLESRVQQFQIYFEFLREPKIVSRGFLHFFKQKAALC